MVGILLGGTVTFAHEREGSSGQQGGALQDRMEWTEWTLDGTRSQDCPLRGDVESGWAVEKGHGEGTWRVAMERGRGEKTCRGDLESGRGEGTWRVDVESGRREGTWREDVEPGGSLEPRPSVEPGPSVEQFCRALTALVKSCNRVK